MKFIMGHYWFKQLFLELAREAGSRNSGIQSPNDIIRIFSFSWFLASAWFSVAGNNCMAWNEIQGRVPVFQNVYVCKFIY